MHSLSAWCATRRDSEPGIVQCAWTSLTSQQLALKIQGHIQHPVGGLSHARSQALAQGSELQKVDWPAIFYSTALPFVGYQSSTCSRFTAVHQGGCKLPSLWTAVRIHIPWRGPIKRWLEPYHVVSCATKLRTTHLLSREYWILQGRPFSEQPRLG